MAHPNFQPIYDLLEYVKGPVRQTQSYSISITQGNNKIAKRNPSEGLVWIV